MKTGFMKGLFAIAFMLLFLPQIASGETSPFKVNTTLLKDHVSAGDLIPVTISISIAPSHHIYKDQIKIESGDPVQFTIASVELPAGKIKYDPLLEKEMELYEGQAEVKSFIHVSKNILAGQYNIKLKIFYQGCSDKVCFAPKTEEVVLPIHVESTNWNVPVSHTEEKPPHATSKSDEKVEAKGFQKTIESRGIFVSLILVFLAGVGLSFTPCIYPMIPITIAVIGGQAAGDQPTSRKPLTAFFLSLIYVLGIAIVYAAMGVTAASTGSLFGT